MQASRNDELAQLTRFAEQWPQAHAVQLVRECKAEADFGCIQLRDAAPWLAALEV